MNWEDFVRKYREQTIQPLFGDSLVARQLEDGLEALVTSVARESSLPEFASQPDNASLTLKLEKEIDYEAMQRLHPSGRIAIRLKHVLSSYEIRTYGQLVQFVKEQTMPYIRVAQGVRCGLWLPNIGQTSLKVLYTHLNEQGIRLFDTPYKESELLPKQVAP